MLGSPACPGTKKGEGERTWGTACADSSECKDGLTCQAGTCEAAPKCESTSDCPEGECNEGVCEVVPEEERSSKLEQRNHWVGLHFGVDLSITRAATGVCGSQTEDAKLYTCYQGGNEYPGNSGSVPNNVEAGHVNSGVGLGTMRALLSYDLSIKRLTAGVRLGFAFLGPPEHFRPFHAELRALYSLTKDQQTKHFRPYLGLAGGMAEVQSSSSVSIVNCPGGGDCVTANPKATPPPAALMAATNETLKAYRNGSNFFFGPTIGFIYAFSAESGIQLNVNAMFPDIVIEPSLGYVMGLF
jgi:hypothetical protein